MNFIERKQIEQLIQDLGYRYPERFDSKTQSRMMQMVIQNGKSFEENKQELLQLFQKGSDFLEQYMKNHGFVEPTLEETKETMKTALDLSDISELRVNGKDYIRLKYADGSIKMLENLNNYSAKEVFAYASETMKTLGEDGKDNAKEIFERIMKTHIEVPLQKNIDQNKETMEKDNLVEMKMIQNRFPDHQIISNPESQIYTVVGKNGEPDRDLTVEMRNGEMTLLPIEGKTYGSVDMPGNQSGNTNTMTEDVSMNEMSEAEIRSQLEQLLMDIPVSEMPKDLPEVLARGNNKEELYQYLQKLKKTQSEKEVLVSNAPNLEQGKRLLLTRPTQNGYIDALILSFLVGISGGVMLTLILNIIHQ